MRPTTSLEAVVSEHHIPPFHPLPESASHNRRPIFLSACCIRCQAVPWRACKGWSQLTFWTTAGKIKVSSSSAFARHQPLIYLPDTSYIPQSHTNHRSTPRSLKKLSIKSTTPNSPFTVYSSQ